MATYRPFAFNSGSTIPGTTQVGYIAVSTGATDWTINGVTWWMGPDEDSGYIIAVPMNYTNKSWNYISIGSKSTVSIDSNGQVWGWGNNGYGQLGNNSISQVCTPVSIQGYKKTFCNISSGYFNTIGIDKNGQVWGWGYNYYGQLGNNSVTSERTPVSILGSKKTFCNIVSGRYHSTSIDKNGQVWTWGYNNYGQLGDNSVISRLTPVSIQGAKKTFCNITDGFFYSLVIDKNGQMWGWGYNFFGNLGDNSTVSKCTPVSIKGAKKTFCKVSSGYYHVEGIDKYGQVWGWGYNTKGGIGDNSITSKCTPVSIQGAKKTFCNISSGYFNTVGIDKNGQVWGWGYNDKGQLGDNSIVSRCTPVSIKGAKKTFCNIVISSKNTMAIDYNGQMWGWGYNYNGQLGDNTVLSHLTPVRVYNPSVASIFPYNSSTEGKYILSPQYNATTAPYLSSDYGSTFQAISGGTILIAGRGSAMSADGKYMIVTSNLSSDLDYKSSDYGVTWTGFTAAPSLTPYACAISDTGQYQTVADHNGYLFVSNDYATSWTQTSSILNWVCLAMNGSGQYQTAGVSPGGQLYRSDNYGVSFTATGSSLNWTGIAISQSGQYQTASLNSTQMFVSSDYGLTWTGVTCYGNKLGVGMSQSGQYQITGHYNNGYLWRSTDYGQSWTELTSQAAGFWDGFGVSGTGKYQVASSDTYIYKSSDYGATWTQTSAPLASGAWNSIAINKT